MTAFLVGLVLGILLGWFAMWWMRKESRLDGNGDYSPPRRN